MKLRRAAAQFVLALLLVLSQQQGIAHAVSHLASTAPSGSAQEKQLPLDRQCDQCLAFAAIGSALHSASHSPSFEVVPDRFDVAAPAARLLPSFIRAFDSRAPPALS